KVLKFNNAAHRDHTDHADLPRMPQQFQQSERQQPPVYFLQRAIYIGHRKQKSYGSATSGFSYLFGNQYHSGIDDLFEVLRHMVELFFAHRHKSPVATPGVIVDPADYADFVSEVLHVYRSNADVALLP